MKATKLASIVAVAVAVVISLAVPAHADQDDDFDTRMRYYELYAPLDFDRYMLKKDCERLRSGSFPNARTALNFIQRQIRTDATEQQIYQILGTGVGFYCPEQAPKLKDMPVAAAAARSAHNGLRP